MVARAPLPSLAQQSESVDRELVKAEEDANFSEQAYSIREDYLNSRLEEIKKVKPKIRLYGVRKNGKRSKRYKMVRNPEFEKMIPLADQIVNEFDALGKEAEALAEKHRKVRRLADEKIKIANQIIASQRAFLSVLN